MMLRSLFSRRTEAAMKAEIIALRHQVIVFQRTQKTTPYSQKSQRTLKTLGF
jgi:hypothetical protein